NPVHLAKSFEKKEFIQRLADKILGFSGKADIIGLPAICGIHNSLDIVKSLEKKIGMDVFEIPGMPPSIPGLRLKNAFEKKLSGLDASFLSNAKIAFHAMEKDHFILKAINDNFETRIKARGVILATGRFPGGGLFARRDIILETVFDLPVFQPKTRDLWHQLNFFDPKGHQINQTGLETDDMFRPLDKTGNPAFENLYAAGSIIAHNDWARLKSGAGVSCVSAYTAVNSFYKKNI
ncbi:MAG: FAD-binding protein, partial [Proteobacteria bacterium]|nr:FAD-binding protein [Pseudomonadota bacterium]